MARCQRATCWMRRSSALDQLPTHSHFSWRLSCIGRPKCYPQDFGRLLKQMPIFEIAELVDSKLFKVLSSWFRSFEKDRRTHLSNVSDECDASFDELRKDHEFFVSQLTELHEFAERGAKRLNKSDEIDAVVAQLSTLLEKMERARRENWTSRRARYEMARTNADNDLESASFWKAIPDDVADAFKKYMEAYASYYQDGGRYRHELRRVLEGAGQTIHLWHRIPDVDRTKSYFGAILDNIRETSGASVRILPERWATSASAYYDLMRVVKKYTRGTRQRKRSAEPRKKKATAKPLAE